jgi:electron transfer flavoprotein alpha subunit
VSAGALEESSISSVLVVAELRQGEPKKITFEMLNAAREIAAGLGGEVSAVVVDETIAEGMGAKLGAHGASKVFTAAAGSYNAETYTDILSELIEAEKPAAVLIGASARGKDLAPRLAAKLDAGLASDVVGLRLEDGKLIARRPVFAGKAFTDVAFSAALAIVTVRINVLDVGPGDGPAATETALDAAPGQAKTAIVDTIDALSDKPDLTEAERIVSGGRGMKSGENFALLEELAEVLGATVGASRAAVDAGYVDGSYQVGQTGKVVNPSLYIACGISGAIQHQAGMRTSKTIVAINKDEKAPIFNIADYGIVADLFEAVPLLIKELKK